MDSIFGIVGKDFVLLAADCKVARSILVYKDDEDKSIHLDNSKVMVTSGPQSDRLAFSEYIQKNMKLYELRNGVQLNGAATAHYSQTTTTTRWNQVYTGLIILEL
ncbi:unnamed protein product [Peronospora belbahrii]|uniref:Proteasome subunit beta n=1 Tax=Peronospora belbahrii TaxID=622444 RepID=A0ABN8CXA7_9STRA|nr:unnamed protein product [Peronospora belbahrii]